MKFLNVFVIIFFSWLAVPFSIQRQTKEGLLISVVRAQRIYNDRSWPNTVVVRLENVDFIKN